MSVEIDNTPLFGRVITAMVTPMHGDGSVDYIAAASLAKHLVDNGSDALVISGTTGESPTLDHDEKVSLFSVILNAVGGRAKIIAGTGSNNTQETIELSRAAQACGVHGLLVVAPYYNKPSQEGLYQHFMAVADATNIPILLYNVPSRTITNIEASTVVRLASHPRIVGIKEASANMLLMGDIIHNTHSAFMVYSGADEVNLPSLALGSVGTISVVSHLIGNDLGAMYDAYLSGDTEKARRIHLRTLSLTKSIFSFPSPGPTKAALKHLGIIPGDAVRLPMISASVAEMEHVISALQDYGLEPVMRESLALA
jgi:4-hydroxy-tetrahydrodipicolinate synthase